MPDVLSVSAEELIRQARFHLESLRSAGIEWLPKAPVADCAPPTEPSAISAPAGASSLFEQASPSTELNPEQRRQALTVLAEQIAPCLRCAELASTRRQTVFGVGRIDAELCFVGEAPGADEDAQGEPFVGAAGQLINRIIAACGMKREEVYICNILKCRPPGNRLPLPHEAANCREYLEKQLELVRPKFICALGACAAQNLLNSNVSIGRMRGHFHQYRGIPVLCTYHPAYLLRNPASKRDVWEDMKKLMACMGRPVKESG
jgi:DNA polymerase